MLIFWVKKLVGANFYAFCNYATYLPSIQALTRAVLHACDVYSLHFGEGRLLIREGRKICRKVGMLVAGVFLWSGHVASLQIS